MPPRDPEENRLTRRIGRYARVGANVGGVAARVAGARLMGRDLSDAKNAASLAAALGGLKGPLMKLAQILSTVPDLLPEEFAAELRTLQSAAPPMGPAFVKRRMQAELGPNWEQRFARFDREPSAAASLGQVHRAVSLGGRDLACKLQYPDMQSAVEADLSQLGVILALQRRFNPEIDTTEIGKELGERLREELDYRREAQNMRLYGIALRDEPLVNVPEPEDELSSRRLLTMTWLDGKPLMSFLDHSLEERNRIATALFRAWWVPFARHGIIHGDPHLGNYSVFEAAGRTGGAVEPAGINLLDFGCIRIFSPVFVAGVVDLYHGFLNDDRDLIVRAYHRWGFKGLTDEIIDILNIWARFIYAPLLDDRVRTIADGVKPMEYGRKEVWKVKQGLKSAKQITVPREFVLMDRAAIGLGSVMLHLRAELNFHQIFSEAIEDFDIAKLERRQAKALKAAGLS